MAPKPVDSSQAADFWRRDLDPQNLGGRSRKPTLPLESELAFQNTPDHLAAFDWLRLAFPSDATPLVLDLGAGLGALSIWMALQGARIIALDSSIERLRELRRRAREAGCADRIATVVATAESLPLASNSLRAVFTKSVLIHTDLQRAAGEIARVLAPEGRAALDEPQPGNPFAWLYRSTLAPGEWKGITRYFGPAEQNVFLKSMGDGMIRHFYLFSFLAFTFQFALPHPRAFRLLLRPLNAMDHLLFRLFPGLMRCAWFGLVLVTKNIRT